MKYDEKEELERTSEWLLRVNKAGFSEELFYVPSELDKLGVAPKDVVDRRDFLRRHAKKTARPVESEPVVAVGRAQVRQMAPVMVLDRPEEEEPQNPSLLGLMDDDQEFEEVELEVPETDVLADPLTLAYNDYGPWEWFGPIEAKFEEECQAILSPEPCLVEFNKLIGLIARRKRIRSSRTSNDTPVKELVGAHS